MAGWLLLFSVATSLTVIAQDTQETDDIDLLLDERLRDAALLHRG